MNSTLRVSVSSLIITAPLLLIAGDRPVPAPKDPPPSGSLRSLDIDGIEKLRADAERPKQDYSGQWRMLMPAGWVHPTTLEAVGDGRYRLTAGETRFNGVYAIRDETLVAVEPRETESEGYVWKIRSRFLITLVEQSEEVGRDYRGTVLFRPRPEEAAGNQPDKQPGAVNAGNDRDGQLWSEVVNGLQARLELKEEKVLNDTRILSVYLTLRNVSDVMNPMRIQWRSENFGGERMLSFRVVDGEGNEVPPPAYPVYSGPVVSVPELVLPFDSTLTFNISKSGCGIPGDKAAFLCLGATNSWAIDEADGKKYSLEATLTIPEPDDSPDERYWHGTIQIPPVEILIAPLSNESAAKERQARNHAKTEAAVVRVRHPGSIPETAPDLSGEWLMTLPAGFEHWVVVESREGNRYRLEMRGNNNALEGVYEIRELRDGRALAVVEPDDERMTRLTLELLNANAMLLVKPVGASPTGASYTGATLTRQVDSAKPDREEEVQQAQR